MIIVEQKMNLIRRTFIVSILCGALPVYAQNTAKKAQEIRLNEEAIRMIQFDFSGTEMPREEMKAASLDMCTDVALHHLDTLWRRPRV